MKQKLIILSLSIVLLNYSCVKKKTEVKEETKATNKTMSDFLVLRDSLNASWNAMISSDDKKLLLVKRLIDEISYTPQPDPLKIEQLKNFLSEVKSRRYTKENLADPDRIDLYDRSTDTLLRKSYALASSTPNIDRYPLVNELVGDINALDNQVVIYRAGYDRWVKDYNAFLEKNQTEIKANLPDSISTKSLGMFELQE